MKNYLHGLKSFEPQNKLAKILKKRVDAFEAR